MTARERAGQCVERITNVWRNIYMEGWDDDEASQMIAEVILSAEQAATERCISVIRDKVETSGRNQRMWCEELEAAIRGASA